MTLEEIYNKLTELIIEQKLLLISLGNIKERTKGGNKNIAWRYIEPFESESEPECGAKMDGKDGSDGCQHET